MSDYSSRDTMQRNQNETLMASFLVFAFVLVLLGGGFGVWKVYVKQEAAKVAVLKGEHQAAEAAMRAQLSPYKVDPDSGKLSKDGDAEGIGENDISRPSDIGPFELIERSGRKITNQDLRGKPWAVCFVFTRCAGPCLGISSKMAMLQKELKGASARLVTITVDPKYDTPEVLQNYAENFGADPDRWLFLTGEPDYVYRLLRGSFRQLVQEMTGKERQKGWEVFHTDDILHIDAEGRIVKRYHGTNDADMIRLRMALLAEAKQLAEKPRTETSAESSSSSLPAVAEKPTGSEGDQ